MKATLLAFGTLGLVAQPPGVVAMRPVPGKLAEGPLLDAHDKQPLLLGETTAKAILTHRTIFRNNLAKVKFPDGLKARWQAVRQSFTLVAVFGSWCGDSHRQLPDLLALEADPNPFIEVHYLGVNRDKALDSGAWPKGCPPQKVNRVPTFYLFAPEPGGGQKLVGSVVETPPKTGQTMAEALVELVEAALKTLGR